MSHRPGRCAASLAVLIAVAAPAQAIDVRTIDVRFENGLYKVIFVAELAAQPQAVGKVLTDYPHYPLLDQRIEDSHMVESTGGAPPRLYTKLRGCLNRLFCRSMVRVENLQQSPGELTATAIPGLSDVHTSVTHTNWQASEKGTRVTYSLELDPKFWVPAFYARRAMLETMRSGTVAMFTSVERVAQMQAAGDAGEH